eukprot:15031.XXX_551620_549931_1 [CDS] Oithona nana genome sequencing.
MTTGSIEANEEEPQEDPEDPDLSQWEKLQKWIYPFLGILCAASAALCMAGQNVIVKTLSHVSPLTITAVRFAVIFLMSSPIATWPSSSSQSQPELPIPSGNWKIFQLVMRCVLGASNIMIHFYALQHLPLADTVMITATSPLFTVFYGRLFIKEAILPIDIFNVVLVFIGMMCIVKPPFLFGTVDELYSNDPEAIYAVIAITLGSIFLQPTVYVILRILKDIHWSVTVSWFGFIGFSEACTVALILGHTCLPASGTERFLMVVVGLCSFLGQIFLTLSGKYENAGTMALLRKAFDVIFAFIFQILFFHQLPGIYSVIGTLLISSAVVSSGLKKFFQNLPIDHQLKNTPLLKCFFPTSIHTEIDPKSE